MLAVCGKVQVGEQNNHHPHGDQRQYEGGLDPLRRKEQGRLLEQVLCERAVHATLISCTRRASPTDSQKNFFHNRMRSFMNRDRKIGARVSSDSPSRLERRSGSDVFSRRRRRRRYIWPATATAVGASSTSRTRWARMEGGEGLWRKLSPGRSIPCSTMASSV